MLYYIRVILIILFICSVSGYIMTVLKEKMLLKNMTLVIDSKAVTNKELEESDQFFFTIGDEYLKSGDEIKLFTKEKERISGIIIGLKKKEEKVIMVTHKDQIIHLEIDNISKLKVVSRYGKFFS